MKWKGSENIFLESSPQFSGGQQPSVKPRGSPLILPGSWFDFPMKKPTKAAACRFTNMNVTNEISAHSGAFLTLRCTV